MSRLLELFEERLDDGFDYELIELFRMIPTRTTGTYFHRERIVKSQQSCARFRSEILHEAEVQILHQYDDKHLCELPELTRQRNAMWYKSTIVPLIEALEGRREKRVILCMRNGDSIRDLPENASVEIPAQVSRKGVRPVKVGSLPRFVKGMYLAAKESDRLTVEAIRHHSYELALQALAINPFVPSVDTARRFLDHVIKEEHLELH
jgi:6-phospho-beta-glucosidase